MLGDLLWLISFKVVLDPNLEGILNLKREIQNSHCVSQYSKIGEAGGADGVTFPIPIFQIWWVRQEEQVDDLFQLILFKVVLDPNLEGNKNLDTEFLYLACSPWYSQYNLEPWGGGQVTLSNWFHWTWTWPRCVKEILNLDRDLHIRSVAFAAVAVNPKNGFEKVCLIVTFYIPSGFKFSGDSEYEVRISKFSLYQSLYPYLYWFAIAKLESVIGNVPTDMTRKAIITVLSHVYTTLGKKCISENSHHPGLNSKNSLASCFNH